MKNQGWLVTRFRGLGPGSAALRRILPRVVLLVVLSLLPALGFEIYTEYSARQARVRLVEEEALRLVGLLNLEQDRIVEGASQVLNAIASTPAVQDGQWPECHRMLGNLMRRSPRYEGMGVVGLDGYVRCAGRNLEDKAVSRLYLGDRFYFKEALRADGFVTGTYAVDRISGAPIIQFSRPFAGKDGAVMGVVFISINLDWLGHLVQTLPLPSTAGVTITDRDGVILARRPDTQGSVGKPISAANRGVLEGSGNGVLTMTNRDGREVVVGYSPPGAEPGGLMVAVWLDRAATFHDVARANLVGPVMIVAGGVMACLIAAFLGARLIRRPVDRLLAAAGRWADGDLAARSGIPSDVSEFGRLGSAFDTMAEKLEAREAALRESEASLTLANAELRRSNSELESFAHVASHDLKEPLRDIGNLADSLQRSAGPRLTGEERARIAAIQRRTGRMNDMVDALLIYSRVGRSGDRFEAVDVNVIVARTLEALKPVIAETGTAVRVPYPLPTVKTDPVLLEGVFSSLISNAVKYSDRPAGERWVEIGWRSNGEHQVFTVTDNGIGIAAENLGTVFLIFRRLHGRNEYGGGDGAGLTIARRAVEHLGGQLWAESAGPGQGSTFLFTLGDTANGGAQP
jgi:signal transduction histidine kinase